MFTLYKTSSLTNVIKLYIEIIQHEQQKPIKFQRQIENCTWHFCFYQNLLILPKIKAFQPILANLIRIIKYKYVTIKSNEIRLMNFLNKCQPDVIVPSLRQNLIRLVIPELLISVCLFYTILALICSFGEPKINLEINIRYKPFSFQRICL